MTLSPEKRQRIRHAVRFFYDVQQLRIQSGNRAGGQAQESEIVLDEDDITFLGKQSEGLKDLEADALKEVNRLIKNVPIYKTWLSKQSGCGPTMSGVILSEVNIHVADTVSKLWSYCGLAVMDDGRTQRRIKGEKAGFNPWLKSKMVSVLADCIIKAGGAAMRKHRIAAIEEHLGENYLTSDTYAKLIAEKFPDLPESKRTGKKGPVVNNEFLEAVLDHHDIALPGLGGWVGIYEDYKHRKTSQIVDVCMNCKGTGHYTEKAKGVRGGKKEEPEKTPGKTTICNNCRGTGGPAPWGTGAAHRNMAAKRYMIKMFLLELWKAWRTLEGLPVGETYAKRYLGMEHGSHGPDPQLLAESNERRAQRQKAKESRKRSRTSDDASIQN